MMNTLLCEPCVVTDAVLDISPMADRQEDFATRPMVAVRAEAPVFDEEELHLSFEEAISERISALGISRSLMSSGLVYTGPLANSAVNRAFPALGPVEKVSRQREWMPGKGWQHSLTYACLAFMFMLIGFDLMGLLILHLH